MAETFMDQMNYFSYPDAGGHWGDFGGSFVPETLMANLDELKAAYAVAQDDPAFQAEFHQ
ncbi:MAG: tryptophan synthase subunit beta, partial [Phycisphaerae bacterium]|nr:tryptophan synthase subunit beta [Saprospiraceae bacterium]